MIVQEAVDDKDLWDDKLTYWHDVYGFDMTSVKHLNLIEPVVDVVAPDTVFSDCCEVKVRDPCAHPRVLVSCLGDCIAASALVVAVGG